MEKKKALLLNVAYYGFFAVVIYLAWNYAVPVLLPFIFAFCITLFLRSPADWLSEKLHCRSKKKWVAVILLILLYLIFFGAIFLGGGKAVSTVADFITNLPELYRTQIVPFFNWISREIGNILEDTDASLAVEIQNGIQQFTMNMGEHLSSLSVNIVTALSEFVTGIPSLVVKIVIMVVASFYMTADYDKILEIARKYLPEKAKRVIRDVRKYGWNTLKAYLKSYFLLFLLTFAELTVGLLFLRIPYAVFIALGIAVFDILPVLGTGGILLPWTVVMLVLGDYPMAVGILLLYIVITVVRNSLEPKIVGKQVGLHPLITLIAMFVGLQLGGLPGLIAAPMSIVILVNMEKSGAIHLFEKSGEHGEEG